MHRTNYHSGVKRGEETTEAITVDASSIDVSEWQFQQAATKASSWLDVEATHRTLRIVRDAAQVAPTLVPCAPQKQIAALVYRQATR